MEQGCTRSRFFLAILGAGSGAGEELLRCTAPRSALIRRSESRGGNRDSVCTSDPEESHVKMLGDEIPTVEFVR